MSRYVDLIGWDDSPHLMPPHVDKEVLDELEADMLPHQRQARRTGRPALGAGAVYPVEEDSFLIDPIAIPDHWERAYGFDVGWKKTAALFGARDPDTDTHYLTGEYYVGEAMPVVHAHGIRAMMKWDYRGAIDPASRGRGQRDGKRLMLEYEDLELNIEKADNAIAAGLHHVLVALQTGQLKVFRTLPYFLREFRLYRRDENGKIIKENDHLMDAMRYLLYTHGIFRTAPQELARKRSRGEW
jgi:hypothetical protein